MYCAAMHLETTWIYHIRTKFLLIPGKQAHSSFYADAFSFKRTCDFVHDRKIGFTSRAPCRPCAGTYVCSSSHVHIIASCSSIRLDSLHFNELSCLHQSHSQARPLVVKSAPWADEGDPVFCFLLFCPPSFRLVEFLYTTLSIYSKCRS